MIYEVQEAARANRYFSKEVRYSQIDWSSLQSIIRAYRQRIYDWYLDPARELAKNVHFAFSVMALNCLLIDTLSQFVSGTDSSTAKAFKQFIRERLPDRYSSRLEIPIAHNDGKKATLVDIADVIYHGFRCGILHQAHITPYGGVDPGTDEAVRSGLFGLLRYKATGAECPSVILNPLILLNDLQEAFDVYLEELNDRRGNNDRLRENFKAKFSGSFGVDITAAQ
jgi:hypothetical protein